MHVEHHDFREEFPQMGDAIDALNKGNAVFARLFATYHRLTGKVENLEEHDMPTADFTMEELKKHRCKVKDYLFHMVLAYRAGQNAGK